MKKKVFIIGNGFDLDLGWKTSYSDFYNSDFWPLKPTQAKTGLTVFLSDRTGNNWFDLEMLLKEYASDLKIPLGHERWDKPVFEDLKKSLIYYLREEEKKDLNTNSLAVKVLSAIVENGYFSSIYSFNYTDLLNIAQKTNIRKDFNFKSVHGSINNENIILGVDDAANLRKGYSFLRKVFSPHYSSNPIRYDLQECDEVVVFGHSLGDIDYPYFKDFFEEQSQCKSRKDSKYITIFTKDDNSRIQILDQLRNMNNARTEQLINNNVFKIIMTEEPDKVLLEEFFKHLKEDSVESISQTLQTIQKMA